MSNRPKACVGRTGHCPARHKVSVRKSYYVLATFVALGIAPKIRHDNGLDAA